MGTYNGHKNWAHWNVALWLNNDEGLYLMARDALASFRNKSEAANYLIEGLRDCGFTKTPDGARYSFASVRAALASFD